MWKKQWMNINSNKWPLDETILLNKAIYKDLLT